MIINVETPSFCPDNCKYYVQEKETQFIVTDEITELYGTTEKCKNEEICIHARQQWV